MQFEVPQFIEIEDKIFGPFTWKQFVYLLGGAGALFIFYVTLPFVLFLLIGAPIAAFSFALGFYQYNNRPFIDLVESSFGYILGSKLYLWKKEPHAIAKKKEAEGTTYIPPSQSTLAAKARQLEINALQNKRT